MSDLPLFDPFKALAEIRQQQAREAGGGTLAKTLAKLSQPFEGQKPVSEQGDSSNSSTLAALAGGPPHAIPAGARKEEEEIKEKSIKSYTYARVGRGTGVDGTCAATTPARAARPAREDLNSCSQTDFLKISPARVLEDGVRAWRDGLASLRSDIAPCPSYREMEWPAVLSRALAFVDTFGPQAEALGWTAPRLFGVHPEAGIARPDACGALVLPIGGPVRAITATEVSFGGLTHREKLGQVKGLPWWEIRR